MRNNLPVSAPRIPFTYVGDLHRLRLAIFNPALVGLICLLLQVEAKATKIEPLKQAIGATAKITEVTTGLSFMARVDTGAETCSLHVNDIQVENVKPDMRDNWKKKIRFSVTCPETKKEHWIDSKIQSTVIVKTSEKEERRYKAWVTLEYEGIEKRVLVTLNDRSHMEYPLLIGRNFLKGDFVVDVAKHANE